MAADGSAPIQTSWTGYAGDGAWDNPDNWTNGVPPSGASYAVGDDVATIDQSLTGGPVQVVISGVQTGGDVTLDSADPGGPAVTLTGTLNLVTQTGGGSFNDGRLDLVQGTFEIDGGTLQQAEVKLDGGTLAFGDAATYGAAKLNAVYIDGGFDIASGKEVDVTPYTFLVLQDPNGYDTVSVEGVFSSAGATYLGGEIDVNTGGVVSLEAGGSLIGWSGQSAEIRIAGGQFKVDGDATLTNATIDGDWAIDQGETVTIAANSTTIFQKNGGADAVVVAIDNNSTLVVEGQLQVIGFLDMTAGTVLLKEGGYINGGLITNGAFEVNGNVTLSGVTIDSNITLAGRDPVNSPELTGRVALYGDNTFGSDSDAPITVDLHGGVLAVFGTLHLQNATIVNGTVVVAGGGTFDQGDGVIDPSATLLYPTSTNWTGGAGNGLWSDPGNWDNGVPASGEHFQSTKDDVATIDNSVATDPFTVTIDGTERVADLVVDAQDPAGAPAVRLTGDLNLATADQNGGAFFGEVHLQQGTFEIDGGHVRIGNLFQEGGTLAFGNATTWGASTIDASFTHGDFTIGNGCGVVIAPFSFAGFQGQDSDGNLPITVTVADGSTLDIQGSLDIDGTIDVVDGTVVFDGNYFQGRLTDSGNPAILKLESGGQLQIAYDFLLGGTATIDGQWDDASGKTLTIDTGAHVTFEQTGTEGGLTLNFDGGSVLDVKGDLSLAAAIVAGDATVKLEGGTIHGGLLQGGKMEVVDSGDLDTFTLDGDLHLSSSQAQAAVSGGSTPPTAILTIDGSTQFGADGGAPLDIDLNGGELDVKGTLHLDNVTIHNGVIVIEQGGALDQGSGVTLDQVTVSHSGFQNVVLTGQDVDLNSYVTLGGGTSLGVTTGVQADGTTPSGTPGTFTVDYGSGVSGVGLADVVDANGPSTTVNAGSVVADGGLLHLKTASWSGGGQFTAKNGGTLEVGDLTAASQTALPKGLLLGFGSYEADAGSTLQLDGAQALNDFAGIVTLDGAGSALVTATPDGTTTTLEQSLTGIGGERTDGSYSDFFGTLRLYDGRGFAAANALTLYGFIGLQGGTLSAPSIDGQTVVFGSGIGTVIASSIAGFGTVDATLTGNLLLEATDYNTLLIDGDVSNLYATYRADPNATIEVTHDLVNYSTILLQHDAHAVLDGNYVYGGIIYQGANASVTLAHGGTGTVYVYGAGDGDSIHVLGTTDAVTSVSVLRNGTGEAKIDVHLASGGDELFDAVSDLSNIAITTSSDGAGGATITFSTGAASALQVNTAGPVNVGQARVGDTATAPISVSNTSATATLGVQLTPLSNGVVTGVGTATLAPGATDSTDLAVGLNTTYAGSKDGYVVIQATQTNAATGAVTYLAPTQIEVKGAVFRPASASGTATAPVVHVGDAGVGSVSVTNTAYQYDGLSEKLIAVAGAGVGVTPTGSTSPIAAGATDSASLGFTYDTSTPGVFNDSVTLNLSTDGDGVDSLGTAPDGTLVVPVTVTVDAYATAVVQKLGGAGVLSVDPNNPNHYILDLGSTVQGGAGLSVQLGVANGASGQADALSGSFDSASGDTGEFSTGGNGSFGNLGAGGVAGGPSISFSSADVGSWSQTITLHPTGSNSSGYSGALGAQTITITGTVLPKPPPPPAPGPVGVAWGDVHYVTFDNLSYNFQGEGEFTLAKSTRAGDSFDVQVRNAPWYQGATVSVTTEVGADLGGGHRVTFAIGRDSAVWIDGAPALALSPTNPLTLGDATITELSAAAFKVTWSTGETLNVVNNGGSYLNATVQLQDDAAPGSVQGLLGSNSGAASAFQLADGTVLAQPLSNADLYGSFADAWRLSQASSLLDYAPGQTTNTFTDKTFPADQISLASLPTALVQAAQQRVAQAGITDPVLAAAAALDFLVTGNPNAITGSQNVAQSVTHTQQANVAASITLSPAVGISAAAQTLVEASTGDTVVTFNVYQTAATTTDTVLHWSVATPDGAADVQASAFGANATFGDVTIAAGATTASFTVALPAGALGAAPSEPLVIRVQGPSGTPVFAPQAQTAIVNDQPTAGAAAQPLVGLLSSLGTLTHNGNAYTLDLGRVVQGSDLGALHFAILNGAGAGADSLAGVITGDGGLNLTGAGALTPIAGGQSYQGLFAAVDTTAIGAHAATITLAPRDQNQTGYDSALGAVTINVIETVVAPAAPVLNPGAAHPNTVDLGVIRSGPVPSGTTTAALSVANTAAAGSAALDVVVTGLSGGATASGNIANLAPGATDATELTVGLDTTTGGAKTGVVTLGFTSDAGGNTAPLSTQTVNVTGTVYVEGQAALTATSSIAHPGESRTRTITVTNATAANGFSEGVEVTAVTATGDFASFTGATGDVAAGASDASSLSLQLPVDSHGNLAPGVYTGSITYDVKTDGTGVDSFGQTDLGPHTQNVTITVANPAGAAVTSTSPVGTLSVDPADPNHYILDLGDLGLSSSFVVSGFGVANTAPAGQPGDTLVGNVATVDNASGHFVNGGFQGFNLAAGSTDGLPQVAFQPDTVGAFSETLQINASSVNGSATVGLAPKTLTVKANVLPVQISAVPVTVDQGGDGHVALSFTNASGDQLKATVVGSSGAVTSASGTTGAVGAGATDGADLTALFNTGAAGVFTGSVGVDIFDVTTGVDLGVVQAAAAITVNAPGVAQIVKVSGAGNLTAGATPNSFVLDLGAASQYGPALVVSLGLGNLATGPADHVTATFDAPTGSTNYLNSPGGLSLSQNPGAGQTAFAGVIALPAQQLGTYSQTFVIHPVDIHPDGSTTALADQTITITGTVNPPPAPPPPAVPTATAWGDVHLSTFSGLTYDFQAAGEFVLARATQPDDSFEVQARMAPYHPGSTVSVMTQIAARVGTDKVTFAVGRDALVWVDGAAATFGADNTLTLGDGVLTQLSSNTYRIVWTNGEVLNVSSAGSYLNLSMSLSPNDGAGSTQGLFGSDGGVQTDFVGADGAPLNPGANTSITSAQLYGTFANAWRVTDSDSLLDYGAGQTTATFTDAGFPFVKTSLSSLPADVVAKAQAFVAAQGITDPALAQAAVLDFLVTGDPGAVTASQNVQQAGVNPVAAAVSQPAPTLPSVGVSAAAISVQQASGASTAVSFTVYLTAAQATDTTVNYALYAPDAGYLGSTAFGGTAPSGAVVIAAGQTSTTFTVNVGATALGSAAQSNLGVQISLPSTETNPIFAPTAQTSLINGTPTAGAVQASPQIALLTGGGSAPVKTGDTTTVDLGRFIQGEAFGVQAAVLNGALAGADSLTGTVASTGTGGSTVSGDGGLPVLKPGESYQGLHVALGTGATGAFSETLTLNGVDTNATGYTGSLAAKTLVLTDTVVAPAQAVFAPTVSVGDVRLDHGVVTGGALTTTLTLANGAGAGDAALDVTIKPQSGDATATGSASMLAGGASDATHLTVGIAANGDGVRTGVVELDLNSDVGGGRTLDLPTQTLTVSGTIYNAADGQVSAPTNLVFHVGDTPLVALTARNVAPADGYSEGLRAQITGFTGDILTATGATGLVGAGGSDSASLGVGVSTATSGTYAGHVTVALTSDGTGLDSFATEDLGSRTVDLAFAVDNHAVGAFAETSGPGVIVQTGPNAYTLDLGDVLQNSGDVNVAFSALNAATGLADLLAGTLSANGASAFTAGGLGGFSGLGAGQADASPTLTLTTDTNGTFVETITLNGVGSNASGFSETLAPVTLTVKAHVVPPITDLAPQLTAPATLLAQQGVAIAVPNLAVTDGDADAKGQTITVTLTAAHGALSATGAGATGSGTGSLTLAGTLAEVNAELATVGYSGPDSGADPISIAVNDGDGGTAAGSIALDVNAPPTVTAPAARTSHAGDTTAVGGFAVADPDAVSANETLTVIVSDGQGLLSATASGGTVSGAGTTALTLTGTLAQVNAALATLTSANATAAADTISVAVDDGRGGHANGAATLTADNHAAPAISVSGGGTLTQTGPGVYTLDLGIVQGGDAPTPVHLTLTNGAAGPADALGATFAVTGDAAFANTGLTDASGLGAGQSDGAPAIALGTGTPGSHTETLTINATGSNPSGYTQTFGAVTVNVVGDVNVKPTLTAPATQTIRTGSASAITGVSVADADATTANETLTVTVSDAHGAFTATGGGTIAGAGSNALTITGTLAQVNADLATLAYTPTAAGAETLTLAVDDGRGGHGAASISVTSQDPARPGAAILDGEGVLAGTAGAQTIDLGTFSDQAVDSVYVDLGVLNAATGAAPGVTGSFAVQGSSAGFSNAFTAVSGVAIGSNAAAAGRVVLDTSADGTFTEKLVFQPTGPDEALTQPETLTVTGRVAHFAPPTVTAPVTTTSTFTGVATALSGVSVADATPGGDVTVVLTDVDGTLSASPTAGAGVAGAGTHRLVVKGDVASVNAALSSLTYTGVTDGETETVAVRVEDAHHSGASTTLSVRNQTLHPTGTTISVPTSSALPLIQPGDPIPILGLQISNPSAGNTPITVQITSTRPGQTFGLGGGADTSHVTLSGIGTQVLQITGTVAQINSFLAGGGGSSGGSSGGGSSGGGSSGGGSSGGGGSTGGGSAGGGSTGGGGDGGTGGGGTGGGTGGGGSTGGGDGGSTGGDGGAGGGGGTGGGGSTGGGGDSGGGGGSGGGGSTGGGGTGGGAPKDAFDDYVDNMPNTLGILKETGIYINSATTDYELGVPIIEVANKDWTGAAVNGTLLIITLAQPELAIITAPLAALWNLKGLFEFGDKVTHIKPKAQAKGDVHLGTFSGTHYDFQGAGEYVLAKSTQPGNSFQIQGRMVPASASASVSILTQVAAQVGTDRVTFDAKRSSAVYVNGTAVTLGLDHPLLRLNGGTLTLTAAGVYHLAWDTGEALDLTTGGALGVTVTLGDNDGPDSVQGLLGSNDATKDFQLPDGTAITAPTTSDALYHQFGDSWRVTQAGSLFDYKAGETTATYTNLTFPGAGVSLASLPTAVVDKAKAVAAAAGITDPVALNDAVLDYIATGDITIVYQDAAPAPVVIQSLPTPAAPPIPLVGVTADVVGVAESASGTTVVTFDLYQTLAAATDTQVAWSVVTPDGHALTAAAFGGTLPSGTATIAAGATTGSFTVTLPTEVLGALPEANLVVQLTGATGPDGVALLGTSARTEIVNHVATPGPAAQPVVTLLSSHGTLTQTGPNAYTVDLGTVIEGERLSSVAFGISNTAADGADSLGGSIAANTSDDFVVRGAGPITPVAPGSANTAIVVNPTPTTVGQQTETLTFTPLDQNDSGYSVALPTQTIAVTQHVIALPTPNLNTPDTLVFGDARVGDVATRTLSITNEAAAGAANLDVSLDAQKNVNVNGIVHGLAPQATDSTTLTVGLNTAVAGDIVGTAAIQYTATYTGANGDHSVRLQPGFVDLYGAVYRPAQAGVSVTSPSVVHVGDNGRLTVEVSNGAIADGFSEGLRLAVAGVSGAVTGGGTTGLIAAGGSDSTSLALTFSTSTSGVFSGTAAVQITSDGTGVDHLAPISSASSLPVALTVDNYALAAVHRVGGAGTLTGDATHGYVLDLGTVAQGASGASATFAIDNAATGLADLLGGEFTVAGDAAFTNGGLVDFRGLGAGQSDTAPAVTLSTANAGTFSETITLYASGSNASGYDGALAPVTVTVKGQVSSGVGVTAPVQPGKTNTGTNRDDTFTAPPSALTRATTINGGGGTDTLALSGPGQFFLSIPTAITGVSVATAREGQAAGGGRPSTAQLVYLRNGQDVTLNVLPPLSVDAANPSPVGISITGADDASVINLGGGADTVRLGSARETVNGGTGAATIFATGATLGSTIHGGTGTTRLFVTGAAAAVMGANITGVQTVTLSGPTSFTANGITGLSIVDASGINDTVTVADSSQRLTIQGGGTHRVLANAAAAGVAITAPAGSTTLEITGGGSATLNPANTGVAVKLDAATRLTLAKAGSVLGSAGDDTFVAGTGMLTKGTSLVGGGGSDTLELAGTGAFFLNIPTALSGIGTVSVREAAAGATTVYLRNGMDVTLNVLSKTDGTAGAVSIFGANDASTIRLGGGAAQVHVGSARETIVGGAGAETIFVDATTIGATIQAGTGANQLLVTGTGAAVMGANVTGIGKVVLNGPSSFTANATAGLQIVDASGHADTIVLGDPSQKVIAQGGGTVAHVVASAANATAQINGVAGGSDTLEITGGGTVVLNANDNALSLVTLDAATDVTLTKRYPIAVLGSGGADTIRAQASNQTLSGRGGVDSLIGSTDGSDTFLDTQAGLNGDSITNFGATGSKIDLTDLAPGGAAVSFVEDAGGTFGTLTAGSASITLFGQFSAAGFSKASDGAAGTMITYTPPANSLAHAIAAPAA